MIVSNESELICTSIATGTPLIYALTSGERSQVAAPKRHCERRVHAKSLVNFNFTLSVGVAFTFREFAGNGVGMGKVIDRAPASFQITSSLQSRQVNGAFVFDFEYAAQLLSDFLLAESIKMNAGECNYYSRTIDLSQKRLCVDKERRRTCVHE